MFISRVLLFCFLALLGFSCNAKNEIYQLDFSHYAKQKDFEFFKRYNFDTSSKDFLFAKNWEEKINNCEDQTLKLALTLMHIKYVYLANKFLQVDWESSKIIFSEVIENTSYYSSYYFTLEKGGILNLYNDQKHLNYYKSYAIKKGFNSILLNDGNKELRYKKSSQNESFFKILVDKF